jgi:uncharacterized tellurite resistance protein B-like protein
MAAVNPQLTVLDKLKSDEEIVPIDHVETVELTPHLVLAASMLYMMASDGQIEDEESSQLQATIGGHGTLLNFALRYVQQVPVTQFLDTAPEALSAQDKLCILSNLCDSMLSDGRSEPDELALFAQFLEAFGVSDTVFEPYFKTITVKNDKSVFGTFHGVTPHTTDITPHLALAASLLYMMSADGSIGAQEIGQLEAVIGEFEGLQKVGLTYVRKVKRSDFLAMAGPVLTDTQKLCILTNVCDSMLSDGAIAVLEDKVFVSMLKAFGFSENGFQIYYQAIETKNIKPFDTSQFKINQKHSRLTGASKEQGDVFDQKVTRNDSKLLAEGANDPSAHESVWASGSTEKSLGSMIHRTMQDNISSVSEDFGSQANIAKVSNNATDQLNVQQISQDGADANVQKIQSEQDVINRQSISPAATPTENTQTIAVDVAVKNLQPVKSNQAAANKQTIDADIYAAYGAPVGKEKLLDNVQDIATDAQPVNVQALPETESLVDHTLAVPVDDLSDHVACLPPEVRMKNLFEDIDTLNRKLDDFEQQNKKILAAAKQARKESQRQAAEALAQSINRQALTTTAPLINVQTLDVETSGENVQDVTEQRIEANRQKITTSQPSSALSWVVGADNAFQVASLQGAQIITQPLTNPEPPLETGEMYAMPSAQQLNGPQERHRAPRPHSIIRNSQRHGRIPHGSAMPLKVYVKATVTFVVLSCWASTIAATDVVRTNRFAGTLERAVVVQVTEQAVQKTNP